MTITFTDEQLVILRQALNVAHIAALHHIEKADTFDDQDLAAVVRHTYRDKAHTYNWLLAKFDKEA